MQRPIHTLSGGGRPAHPAHNLYISSCSCTRMVAIEQPSYQSITWNEKKRPTRKKRGGACGRQPPRFFDVKRRAESKHRAKRSSMQYSIFEGKIFAKAAGGPSLCPRPGVNRYQRRRRILKAYLRTGSCTPCLRGRCASAARGRLAVARGFVRLF